MKYKQFNQFYDRLKNKAQVVKRLEEVLTSDEIKQILDRIPDGVRSYDIRVYNSAKSFGSTIDSDIRTSSQIIWLLGDGEITPELDFSFGMTQVVLIKRNYTIKFKSSTTTIEILSGSTSEPCVEEFVKDKTVNYDLDKNLQVEERETIRRSNHSCNSYGGSSGGQSAGGRANH